MAWLGVNLNDSLNSIKGQISNFTKEVLNEDGIDEGNFMITLKIHRFSFVFGPISFWK